MLRSRPLGRYGRVELCLLFVVALIIIRSNKTTLALSDKQKKFVESYLVSNNAKESAIIAGYPSKNAASLGWQLLKSPKVLEQLNLSRAKIRATITKDKYIDTALEAFESLDKTEPNAPRFYDIAGKALGYIGATSPNTTTNNTLNITNISADATQAQVWEQTRRLIGNE